MKYDRPVTALLRECVASLDEPFSRGDILEWFRRYYPDLRESTVSTHIAGLTVDEQTGRGKYQFAHLPPLLERVGRGLYRRAGTVQPRPAQSRPAATSPRRPAAGATSVLLIGCVKSKRPEPAPARSLYTGALFGKRVAYAEASGLPWFVLSSRWGLVDPDELIAPYDMYLGDTSSAYRRAWGDFVTAQLAQRMSLAGTTVEIHAGDHYVNAVRPALEKQGAAVSDPVEADSMGATLAWYGKTDASPIDVSASEARDAARALARHLTDPGASLSTSDLRARGRSALARPGLYSWWADDDGAADLSAGLGLDVPAGLIYAGLAGATRWPSGKASTNTLWGRLVGMHLGARATMSTFRRTLGAILTIHWDGFDEQRLTAWMDDHLRVTPVVVADANTLGTMEDAVLAILDPPLNLKGMPPSPVRTRLTLLRKAFSG